MRTEPDLAELRGEIAQTTKEIIRLAGRRNDLAREVGVLKRGVSLPMEDEAVEDALLKEVVAECDKVGLDRGVGLKILGVLLSESKKTQGLEQKTPMSVFARAMALQGKGVKLLRLDVGEPDFRPPQPVLEACSAALFAFKTHYTESRGIPELRDAVRRYVAKKQHYDVAEEEIAITPGGRFAVYAGLASVVGEGESAIIIDPSWPAYRQALQQIGAKTIAVHTLLEDQWEPSLAKVEEAIRPNTKAIVLSYPNNPTGRIISKNLFKELVELADDRGLTVVSDEIYTEYAYKPCPSVLETTPKKFILTASFSKTWAMTGFRIGYAISSRETVTSISKMTSLVVTSVPEFVQYGAIKALDAEDYVKRNVREMKERIDAAIAALNAVGSLECAKPDGAMYLFPRLKNFEGTGDSFSERLLEKGVSVTPGSSFGDYRDFFRISLAQPKELIEEGIGRMGELLA